MFHQHVKRTPTATQRPLLAGIPDDQIKIRDLPFVAKRRPDGEPGRHFWSVTPTGDYATDCLIGRQYALEAVHYMRVTGCPPLLTWIVLDMPRRQDRSGIEVGFLHTVAEML